MQSCQLQLQDIGCIRGDRQLFSQLNLSLAGGELFYLEGRNGSGKTTLLRTLCGLFHPDDGQVLFNGQPITQIGEAFCRQLLFIGHHSAIKLELTPLENLRFACELDGLTVTEAQLWAALAEVDLKGFEDLPAKMLSQGQKRKIALARLYLSDAPLWILDEPFTALDVDAVARLQQVIADHVAKGGLVVLTTHQEVALTAGEVKRHRLGQ